MLLLNTNTIALTRAALGSPAERAALAGGKFTPPPPANSRTRGRSESGETAIESSQQLLLMTILKFSLKVTSKV